MKSIVIISFFLILFLSFENKKEIQCLENNLTDTASFSKAERADTIKISKEIAKKIKPAIKKWLDFYDLDINEFYLEKESEAHTPESLALEDDTTSVYYEAFDKVKDDVYLPAIYDYSPNKRFYLNVLSGRGIYEEKNGVLHYLGADDCMAVYLTDRKKGNKSLVLWLGSFAYTEAGFWAGNDVFIIVGGEYHNTHRHFVYIRGKINQDYYINRDEKSLDISYFKYNAESRGIVVED